MNMIVGWTLQLYTMLKLTIYFEALVSPVGCPAGEPFSALMRLKDIVNY